MGFPAFSEVPLPLLVPTDRCMQTAIHAPTQSAENSPHSICCREVRECIGPARQLVECGDWSSSVPTKVCSRQILLEQCWDGKNHECCSSSPISLHPL